MGQVILELKPVTTGKELLKCVDWGRALRPESTKDTPATAGHIADDFAWVVFWITIDADKTYNLYSIKD